jgi:hypothetical protein
MSATVAGIFRHVAATARRNTCVAPSRSLSGSPLLSGPSAVLAGNGAPTGAHYNLIVIGFWHAVMQSYFEDSTGTWCATDLVGGVEPIVLDRGHESSCSRT